MSDEDVFRVVAAIGVFIIVKYQSNFFIIAISIHYLFFFFVLDLDKVTISFFSFIFSFENLKIESERINFN